MKKTMVAIRGLDKDLFRKFKAKAVEEKVNIGDALTIAMKKWLDEKEKGKYDVRGLLKLKAFHWGKGTEKTSKEIDEILYGKKK